MGKIKELSIAIDNATRAFIQTYYGHKAYDAFRHELGNDSEYKFGAFLHSFGCDPELFGDLVVGTPLCCECSQEAMHIVDNRDIGYGIEYVCDSEDCQHYAGYSNG